MILSYNDSLIIEKMLDGEKVTINQLSEQVPLMFRAQIDGRCQLHYINNNNQIERWVSEWIDPLPKRPYQWRENPQQRTHDYKFNWRFVTNGGQDEGIIRPAIGTDPTDNRWRDRLIDLVHPQQGWQVKTGDTTKKPKGESAFDLISLYKPELKFCISSPKPLSEEDWGEIWQIWDKAIASELAMGERQACYR
ncbi:hypothetical protein [Spirulina sp. 06S082]|uniref:hypothetical protein n=1 Tax=Spirulina sp. 06S082 TaxID=3110248 RepID=UPI002B220D3F|nr:hypothetical protein [Spirulina sp. 06S082]MEA5470278.1 hypothetical protein [Spirulina sp. 06S082]